jgi:4-amino-4-deoxy-L-arabinose transferase-like glycosyltransferase
MDIQRTEWATAGGWWRVWTGGRQRPLAVVLLVAAFALWTLGRASWTPDEPREWGIAAEALAGHGLVVPTLSGERFVEKPPLTYWAGAASMTVFGPTVAAARAPNLLWALISILSVA